MMITFGTVRRILVAAALQCLLCNSYNLGTLPDSGDIIDEVSKGCLKLPSHSTKPGWDHGGMAGGTPSTAHCSKL